MEPVPARQLDIILKWKTGGSPPKCWVLRKNVSHGRGHARTASEVAITYAAYPDQVRDLILDPKIASMGYFTMAYSFREVFPNGLVGSEPTKASIESGKVPIQLFADAVAKDFRRFMDS